MADPLTLASVFVIGVVTGLVDVLAGIGGFVALPFLIMIGLPPHVAIATDRLGTLGSSAASFLRFWKGGAVVWALVLPLSVIALAGGWLGAQILLEVDEKAVMKIVGVVLLLLLPLILKSDLGLEQKRTSVGRRRLAYAAYFAIMVYSGFIGIGMGPFNAFLMMGLFGLTITQSNATTQIPWMVQALISSVVFAINGIIQFEYALTLMLGMAAGGYWAAHSVLRRGDRWFKRVFTVLVAVAAMKLLFFGK